MPLFEFTCRKCGHVFEELMSAADAERGGLKCPACKSTRVDRGFAPFATGGAIAGSGSGGGCGSGGFT